MFILISIIIKLKEKLIFKYYYKYKYINYYSCNYTSRIEEKIMSGRAVKYKKYEKKGSGEIYIPISVTEALKWVDGDELMLTIEVIDGNQGIFLYKKKN